MSKELDDIAKALTEGLEPTPVSTRDLLWWFGAQRRSYWNIVTIRSALEARHLRTVPDFETTWLDAPITFELVGEPADATAAAADEVGVDDGSDEAETRNWMSTDPTYRLSKLEAANQPIISINPTTTVSEAITLMMLHDFSQLPVMTGERTVKGVVTWRSIALRTGLGRDANTASDVMDRAEELPDTATIFEAIPIIGKHNYVLVRGADQRVNGIVTSSDLNNQFRALSEPFLLLSEIENIVREIIGDRFDADELAAACDPSQTGREITSPADMNFGEYIRLLEAPDNWNRLGFQVDRGSFCRYLDSVRQIRNDVMHFDPDGIPNDDLEKLRTFKSFLIQLQEIYAQPAAS